jgi:hypothetical protein
MSIKSKCRNTWNWNSDFLCPCPSRVRTAGRWALDSMDMDGRLTQSWTIDSSCSTFLSSICSSISISIGILKELIDFMTKVWKGTGWDFSPAESRHTIESEPNSTNYNLQSTIQFIVHFILHIFYIPLYIHVTTRVRNEGEFSMYL